MSRITSEVDFDRDGKQVGFLRLPHSVHRSAYGWIPIPVACIRNGDGPRVLLMAGNHGDEYEGQIAFSTLLRALQASDVPRPPHLPHLGKFPCRHGRHAHLADRRGQSQPLVSRRPRRRGHGADRAVHRARAAAAMRLCLRPSFRRQFADVHPERPVPAPRGPGPDGARARIARRRSARRCATSPTRRKARTGH